MSIVSATKEDLLNIIENEAKIRVDSFIESAIELVEELHSDVKREDEKSSYPSAENSQHPLVIYYYHP